MDFAQPPPNLSVPPPGLNMLGNPMGPPMGMYAPKFDPRATFNNRPPFRPFLNLQRLPGPLGNMTLEDFDGKRLRKSVMRKTVDYNSAIIKALENRVWTRDYRDRRALQPDVMYYPDMMPPPSYHDNPINCVTTRFVKTATNKMRCPIFCMAWTPEGRRLVTGASSGEFTLWNGLTFNFETILQAHDSPVRCMVWSHNDSWMVTGDHAGYVKYWQSNMNNVKMFQAHKEALRGISFSPMDSKFVTCSDDGTLRIWDFFRYQEEKVLRGHGADVKCVHWHPQKGLIISGSKDNQQPIKLWDPKTGQSLATLHAHKSTVMDLKWNENGNWLITASRDHLLKLFDLRNLGQEVQTFRGHKKEASSVAWHPVHEGLFCSGGSDGAIMFWHVGADKEVGAIEQAHDSIVWTLAWHPLGHILCSGSNDHTSKFWTRNRPGDLMRDKYNLNTLPAGIAGLEDVGDLSKDAMGDEPSVIPGMGPDDKVEFTFASDENAAIPGLDLDLLGNANDDKAKTKKVPYSKPIPRNFQAQWNETNDDTSGTLNEVLSQIVENTPGVVPLQKINPSAIIVAGKIIPVESGSKLETAIAEGPEALNKFLRSGEVAELADVMLGDDNDYLDTTYIDDDNDSHPPTSTGGPRPLMETPITPSKFQNHTDFLGNHRFIGGVGGGDGDSSVRRSTEHPFNFLQGNNNNGGGKLVSDVDYRNKRGDYDMRGGGGSGGGSNTIDGDVEMIENDYHHNRPYHHQQQQQQQQQKFRNNRYNNDDDDQEYYDGEEEEEDEYEDEEYDESNQQSWPNFNAGPPPRNRNSYQNFRQGLPPPPPPPIPNDFTVVGPGHQFNVGNSWNGSKDGSFRGARGFRRNNLLGPQPPPIDNYSAIPRPPPPPLRGVMRGRGGLRGILGVPLRRGKMEPMRRPMGGRGRGLPPRGARNAQY